MNGRDRVVAALAGDVADRPPISAWGHDYEVEWYPHLLEQATAHAATTFDWDWVKLQNRETCFAESLGGIYRPDPSGRAFPVSVRTIEDVAGWNRVIEIAESGELGPSLIEQLELISRLSATFGSDRPVIQTVFSPLSIIGYLVGRNQAKAVEWLRREPELIQRVMTAIGTMLQDFTVRSIEHGAAGIFYAIVGYASADLIPEGEYREKVLASDTMVLESATEGWFNMLHLCFDNVYFGLADELPAQSVSWSTTEPGNPSLEGARQLTSRARVGGLDRHNPIRTGTPAEVFAAGRDALAGASPRGVLFAPGCSVSPWPKDRPEQMLAFRASIEGGD